MRRRDHEARYDAEVVARPNTIDRFIEEALAGGDFERGTMVTAAHHDVVDTAPGLARDLPTRVREDFVDPTQWRVSPDVFPALARLSSTGWTHLVLSSIDGGLGLGERTFDSAETGYEKPHPEAYHRVLRTLGDEVEAARRVVGAGREGVCVPELCVSHGW